MQRTRATAGRNQLNEKGLGMINQLELFQAFVLPLFVLSLFLLPSAPTFPFLIYTSLTLGSLSATAAVLEALLGRFKAAPRHCHE
jgi:hypothetical protein